MTPREQRIFGFAVFAAFAVFVLVLPQFISDFRARDYAYVGIYLIALLGLNILTGYTGQISLGHGAFMAIGGYTTAILMAGNEQFGGPIPSGVQDIWTLPIAGLVAGLFGLAFGLPALRLSGLYLALATFAIAVAMPSTVKRFEEYTGGGQGIQLFGLPELTGSNAVAPADPNAPASFELLGLTFTQNDWMYYLAWSIALVAFAGAWLILRADWTCVPSRPRLGDGSGLVGREPRPLQDARVRHQRGIRGRGGRAFAIASAFVNPDTFPIALSIFLLVGIVVGGLGGLSGLVVGAIFVAFLPLWAQGQDLGSCCRTR